VDGFKHIIDGLRHRFGGLSFNQKVLLGAVGTASLICLAVFSLWLQQEDMAVLFTNLTPEDASVALQELAKLDVPTELANGGTTVMVPAGMKDKLRLELAGKGIPSSGVVGFEIFDGNQYGLTDFLQNVNFKRALEGELTKTIESLAGIQSARVHLVLPKPSLFKKIDSSPTASVVLKLGRGAALDPQQITGIQNLVASGVEDLKADQVAVIDQNGVVLSSAIKDDDIGRSETQLALKKEVEAHLAEKASSMLDRVLGSGRSIVRVDATLNFEQIEKEREIFDPAGTVIRSEERNEVASPSTGDTQETSTTNYEIGRTLERIVSETGGVKSLSVAVFVDGHYEPSADGEEPIYTPLSEEEIGQLRRVVQTAVGLNNLRGDQLEVVNMQFQERVDTGSAIPATDWIGIGMQYGGKVLLLGLLVVLALGLRKNLAKLLDTGGTSAPAAARVRTAAPAEEEHFDGIPEMNEKVVSDIQDFAAENPERVADVIQSWIHGIDLGDKAWQAAGD